MMQFVAAAGEDSTASILKLSALDWRVRGMTALEWMNWGKEDRLVVTVHVWQIQQRRRFVYVTDLL